MNPRPTSRARRSRTALAAAALLALGAGVAAAGERLSIRLVEARQGEREELAPQLRDVARLLRDNLPYAAYELLDSRTVSLPAKGAVPMAHEFTLYCYGMEDQLSLTLDHGGRVVLQTQIALREGRPFILGGFPGPRGGRILLVVLVQ